jgi:putative transposase
VDYVDWWADGVHFSIRLGDQGRLCCLVIVGVRADGTKELVAVADGTRESTDDWAELLRALRRRGMGAPVVMVGDGRLGCGGRCGRSSPPPASSDAGFMWSAMSLVRCPRASTPAPAGR